MKQILPITKPNIKTFPGYNSTYTDSCLSGSIAASAAALGEEAVSFRQPDKSSIYTVELYVLLIACHHIEDSTKKHFIILSDSKSALQALHSKDRTTAIH